MLTLFQKYLSSINAEDIELENGSISFKRNSLYYLFLFDKKDPFYFRLTLPNVINIAKDNKDRIINAINTVNLNFKVAKAIVLLDGNVWISAEQFVYCNENINQLFERMIGLLEVFIYDFRKEVEKEETPKTDI